MNPLRLAIELRKVAESWVDTKPWFRIDGGYKHGLLTVIVTSGE